MRRKRRFNPLLFILMSGLVAYFIITYFRQQEEFSLIRSELRAIEHKIKQEEQIQEKLLEQQSKAGTDEFIESIAREKLGMVKPGERLFVDSE
ncbi:MAG: septum formation initiator family protein [Clostridiaceae bacterium]|nr:septum formation initiator family protein [Clostridiaceae bacterium]